MKGRFAFSKKQFAILIASLTLLNSGCDRLSQNHENDSADLPLNQALPADFRTGDIKAFEQSLYPLVRQHCAACHSSFVKPQFAADDVNEAWQITQEFRSEMTDYHGQPLVNFEELDESRIFHRLRRDKHSCWSDCESNASEILTKLQLWKDLRDGGEQVADCSEQETSLRRVRLLSNAEYLNTLQDLFGEAAIDGVHLPNDVSGKNLFDNIGSERPVQLSQIKAYYEAANQLADNIIDQGAFQCTDSQSCVNQWLEDFAWKLWRRPLSHEEEVNMRELFSQSMGIGNSNQAAMKQLVTATLLSPNFLYRSELGSLQDDGSYILNSWEIASALSYFFWRSLPDNQLFNLARADELQNSESIRKQINRLLEDNRSRRGLGDFVQLWTRSYRILETEKADSLAQQMPRSIREQLAKETVDFFMYVVFQDEHGDYQTLMNAAYSIGDDKLAEFYGVSRDNLGRLDFSDSLRRGLASQGSLMASYAFPDESSPIHRGVFILENLLCRHFPEPPAVTIPEREEDKTNRDRFKDHSKLAECAVCHTQIDGVGFGFENFDAIGLYREVDAGQAVDASGQVLIDGAQHSYQGAGEFAQLLANSKEGPNCFVRQALRFQSGALESGKADQCRINRMFDAFAAEGFQLKALMKQIFTDPAFLNRRTIDQER